MIDFFKSLAVFGTALLLLLLFLATPTTCAARKTSTSPRVFPEGSPTLGDLFSPKRSLQQKKNAAAPPPPPSGAAPKATPAPAPSLSEEERKKLSEQLLNASRDGILDAVKAAINLGASIEHKDEDDRTSLYWAGREGHFSVVEYLLEQGADVNAENKYGWTPLMTASFDCKSPDVVTLLIDSGADVDHQSANGDTALTEASWNGHLECVNILINEDAPLDIQDDDGDTALMMAALWCYPSVAQALVDAGANTKLKNEDGDTARDKIDCGDDLEDERKKLEEILGD